MTDVSEHYSARRAAAETPEAIANRTADEILARAKAAPTAEVPPQQDATAKKNPNSGSLSDYGMQVVGGARETAVQGLYSLNDFSQWLGENLYETANAVYGEELIDPKETAKSISLFKDVANTLPEVERSDALGPQLVRGASQFIAGMIPVTKALRAMGAARTWKTAMTAGAVTDAVGFDPHEARVSDLINNMTPSLRNPITDYLAADPNDSNAEGRMKNAIEGLGLGVMADGLFKATRLAKNALFKGKDPKAAADALDANLKKVADESAAKVEAANVAKAADAAPAKVASAEATQAVKAAADLPAPPHQVVNRQQPYVRIRPDDAEKFAKAVRDGDIATAEKSIDFNLDNVEGGADLKQVYDKTSEFFAKVITNAKGGAVRSHETVKEVADMLGMGVDKVNALYTGTKNLDAKMLAARHMLASVAKRTNELAVIAEKSGSVEDLVKLQKHVKVAAAVHGQVKSAQTEIARALNAHKLMAKVMEQGDALDALLNAHGGYEVSRNFARKVARMTDPVEINNFVRGTAWARTNDAVLEYYINSLLSGPKTFVVNALSNTFMIPAAVTERAIAVGISTLRGNDAVMAKELTGQLVGIRQGIGEALRISQRGRTALKGAVKLATKGDFKAAKELLAFDVEEFGSAWRTLATETPVLDQMTRFEHRHHAISAEAFKASGWLGQGLDLFGFVTRIPSRLMLSTDELFKSIGYRMEVTANAYGQASRKGLTGEAFKAEVQNIISAPPKGLHDIGVAAARFNTFTQELGEVGKAGQNFVSQMPLARLVLPFIRTPTNIFKYFGTRTPGLNLLASQARANLAKGGRAADLELAKTGMGIMLYTGAVTLALSGNLTGGGTYYPDKSKRYATARERREAGMQDYSFKVGDEYIAYNRLDPFGMFFGVVADLADLAGHVDEYELNDLVAGTMLAFRNNITNKTWMESVSSVVAALDDPNKGAGDYLRKITSSFVPNVFNQLRVGVDPEVKEIRTLLDAVKARIPYLSSSVAARRDLFGEPVHYAPGLGPDLVSPIYSDTLTDDPVVLEIARLGVGIPQLPKSISHQELTGEQYSRWQELAGKVVTDSSGRTLRARLEHEMSLPKYASSMTDSEVDYEGSRGYMIKKVVAGYRQKAQAQLLKEFPELGSDVQSDKRRALETLLGRPLP